MTVLALAALLGGFAPPQDRDAPLPPGGAPCPERQEEAREGNPPSPEAPETEENCAPFMEFLWWNSRLEVGILLTRFDKDLDIETDPGGLARYLLHLTDFWSVSVSYRHYGFDNSDLPGVQGEYLRVRELLAGGDVRYSLTPEIGAEAGLAAGAVWWESLHAERDDDTGWILSGQAALTVRLHSMVRLKIGGVADLVRTDFHRDSAKTAANLSGLLAFEIGM